MATGWWGSKVTSDVSTTAVTWTDLLTVNSQIAVNQTLRTYFTTAFKIANNNLTVSFRILVDGVSVSCGGSVTSTSGTGSFRGNVTLFYTSPSVSVGMHTVKIQWKLSTVGTATIDNATNPDLANACLSVHLEAN